MKVLVINADCVCTNSSANLCHLAYIKGLLQAGHEVSLLSASANGRLTDPTMHIPEEVTSYTYDGLSLYGRLSRAKQAKAGAVPTGQSMQRTAPSFRSKLIRKVKNGILACYGIHGIYATFARKARKFTSPEEYDYILSLSTPTVSHLLAYQLIKSGRVKGKQWIQIWEDPWYSDVYGGNHVEPVRREEKKLLSYAQKICYVSPLTLRNQQKLFTESAHKMYWQPLPFYYKSDSVTAENRKSNLYGYFGDYVPESRNLAPFYEAAKECTVDVNICGNPCNLFASTERIHIHPRLTLDKLKPIEDHTNVLVFLCNRTGGQIPGKIYQYSATCKTVLFILDGTEEEKQVLSDFFSPLNRYVFCQNTKESISEAIRRIESGDLGGVNNIPLEVFDPKVTIQKILDGGCK